MKKTVCGSFIICCDYLSYTFDLLNSAYPKYKDKSVCIIQCKVKRCKDKNTIMMYELIYN
jgi:hypothetical protein